MSGAEGDHEGQVVIGDIATPGGPANLTPPSVKYVWYPGSQQLIVWLPKPAYQGYGELAVTRAGVDVERGPVSRRMNGGVQILFGTLHWAPGDYLISIAHEDGWRHEVSVTKLEPGVQPPREAPPSPVNLHPPERNADGAIIYRDGLGQVIPDTDFEMRGAAMRSLTRKFARRLEYEGNYRAGTIYYCDGERRVGFWHEMCGGGVQFSINIPVAEHWEAQTGMPLAERDDVVAFIAEQVKHDQAPNWRYEITGSSVDFY